MKNFKQIAAAFILVLASTTFTLAGDTPCGVLSTGKSAPTSPQTSALETLTDIETLADTTYQFLGFTFLGF